MNPTLSARISPSVFIQLTRSFARWQLTTNAIWRLFAVVPAEAGIKGRSVHALDTRGQVTCCQAARQSAKYAKRPATAPCHPPCATCTARTNPRQGRPRRWLRLQPPRRVSPLLRRCHRSCFLGLGQQAVKMSQDVMSEFQATLNPSRIFWISLHVGSKYSLDIWGPAIGSRILFEVQQN